MTQHGDADEARPDQSPAEDEVEKAAVEAYDLDGDGRVSLTEDWRAEIGIVDARAEELAEKPGVKGKFARLLHRLLDRFDND